MYKVLRELQRFYINRSIWEQQKISICNFQIKYRYLKNCDIISIYYHNSKSESNILNFITLKL